MKKQEVMDIIEKTLAGGNGILRLEPAWMWRDFLPPGRRLGFREGRYDAGERGFICELWLASTTNADNQVSPLEEGLSYLRIDGEDKLKMEPHSQTIFEVHPRIVEEKKHVWLLPHIEAWNSYIILRHSCAYLQGSEGVSILALGCLHAPGTAVTIKSRENSDLFSIVRDQGLIS